MLWHIKGTSSPRISLSVFGKRLNKISQFKRQTNFTRNTFGLCMILSHATAQSFLQRLPTFMFYSVVIFLPTMLALQLKAEIIEGIRKHEKTRGDLAGLLDPDGD